MDPTLAPSGFRGQPVLSNLTSAQMDQIRGRNRRGQRARLEKAYVAMFDAAVELEESLKVLGEWDDPPSTPLPPVAPSRRGPRERAYSVRHGDAPAPSEAASPEASQLALVPYGRAVPPPHEAEKQEAEKQEADKQPWMTALLLLFSGLGKQMRQSMKVPNAISAPWNVLIRFLSFLPSVIVVYIVSVISLLLVYLAVTPSAWVRGPIAPEALPSVRMVGNGRNQA